MYYKWLIIFCFISLVVSAQKSTRMSELEKERDKALADIEFTNQLLRETSRSATTSLNRLNLLTQQITSRNKVISLLNQEVQAIDGEVNQLQREINALEKELSQKKQNYGKSIQGYQKRYSSQDKLLFILSADNFTQSVRRMRYLREYADWQKRQAGEIVAKQTEITTKKETLEKTRKEKQTLLAEREKETKKLDSEKNEQKKESDRLNRKKRELESDLKKKRQLAQNLNKQIDKIIAEEIARAEAEAKAARDKKAKDKTATVVERTADTKGGYAMTREEKQLSTNFADNRGKLPFPVTGKYTVVGLFGEHVHPQHKNVRVNNNGIEIQTTPGAEARSVFDGVVTSVLTFKGYNYLVIVRHGNYLTIYANLIDVYVKKGDKVKTRQSLGKIYTDEGDANSTILHFELRKETQKLNPRPWLN